MARCLAVLCLLFSLIAVADAQQSRSGWVTDTRAGCKAWSNYMQDGESIRWSGKCVDGYVHGRGTLKWFESGKNVETDEGEFIKGKLHGFAVITTSDGKRFEGEFRDNKPEGKGTLETESGEVYSGRWARGCFRGGKQDIFFFSTQAECQYH
jgi:hypothetical protein